MREISATGRNVNFEERWKFVKGCKEPQGEVSTEKHQGSLDWG